MAFQMTFQRYELKYLLTRDQKARILEAMEPYMELDQYGRTTIRNLYYDTGTYRLVRRSLEKPVYKEKLRVRSYRPAAGEDPVFVELKKKYRSVVYKRRIVLPEETARRCLEEGTPFPKGGQIAGEIDYFRSFYGDLAPRVFLSYEREAFYQREGGDFRVTFDEKILWRQEELTLAGEAWGREILPPGYTLMELKTSGGLPLWMVRELSRERVFRTSFSTYGSAYQAMLLTNNKGVRDYAG